MNWPVVKLGDVVNFIGGAQPPKTDFVYEERNGYIRMLQIRDYKSDKNKTYIPLKSARRFCSKDDVMIGRYGPPVFQILRGLEGSYNVALMKAEPNKHVNNDYLYHFLRQEKLFKLIDSLSQRTAGQSGVDMDVLKAYPMRLPALHEQKRIAAILDKADSLRRKRQQAIQLADDFLRATFLDMFGDPLTNPKVWPVLPLGQLCSKIGSGSTPRGGDSAYKTEGISLIRSLNVRDGYFRWKDLARIDQTQADQLANVSVQANDVLINITGASVARVCRPPQEVLPARVNQHVSILRTNEKLIPVFLESLLLSTSTKNKLLSIGEAGATRQAITKAELEFFEVIVPPLELQKKFEKISRKILKMVQKKQTFEFELTSLAASLNNSFL